MADKPPAKRQKSSPAKGRSSAHYQREYRKRLREQGLVKKEVWIRPENAKLLTLLEKQLREHNPEAGWGDPEGASGGWIGVDGTRLAESLPKPSRRVYDTEATITVNKGGAMTSTQPVPWTTETLFEKLVQVEPFSVGDASIEIIEGKAPALHLIMHEYGDLPVFVTVAGEQIIVEAVLWSLDEVQNPARFNDAILRSHKYFPLSTISLDSVGDGKDYYYMFGALSAASILTNIVFEVEVLAFNVIQAAEAYSEFLAQPMEASS